MTKLCVVGKRWLAFTVQGKNVFHVARFCGKERLIYWFTFDLKTVFSDRDGKGLVGNFDARQLPDKYRGLLTPEGWITAAIIDGYDFTSITNQPPTIMTTNHGGQRQGAGRKTGSTKNCRKIVKQIRFSAEEFKKIQKAANQCGANFSEFARAALAAFVKIKQIDDKGDRHGHKNQRLD